VPSIALISDIHGNSCALEAVLAELPSDARVVCLGDAIQGGGQPALVARLLRALRCPVVMGNADAWLLSNLSAESTEAIQPEQREVGEWTLSQLTAADLDFMRSFLPTVQMHIGDGQEAAFFHGSARSYDELIFPETPQAEVLSMLEGHTASLFAGGHTHTQQLRRLPGALFVNPGSVGVAYDRSRPGEPIFDPWAEYAVVSIERGRLSVDFRRVPFDVQAMIEDAEASGRPYAPEMAARYAR
jgi:predicted phosphodiesterase